MLIHTVQPIPAGAISNVRGVVENLMSGLLGSVGGLLGGLTGK